MWVLPIPTETKSCAKCDVNNNNNNNMQEKWYTNVVCKETLKEQVQIHG